MRRRACSQIKPEKSLEDFLINRFGRELYLTFFKSYTEKVWGTPCHEISAEWGAQRIKGLSLTTAVKHFVKKMFRGKKRGRRPGAEGHGHFADRAVHVSEVRAGAAVGARRRADPAEGRRDPHGVEGGQAELRARRGRGAPLRVESIEAVHNDGERRTFAGDYFFSTMPMRELIRAMDMPVPANVLEVSDGLQYRDFITVGLLADRLKVKEPDGGLLKDTWIYIQEPDVLLGTAADLQ